MHTSDCYEQQVKNNSPQKNPVQGGIYKHTLYFVFKLTFFSPANWNKTQKYLKLAKCHWIYDLTALIKKK